MSKKIRVLGIGGRALTDTTIGKEYVIDRVVAPGERCTDGTLNNTDYDGLEFIDDVGDRAVVIDGSVDPCLGLWEVIE